MISSDHFDLELKFLLEAIYSKYNYDFRGYSLTSVERRVRAALENFELTSVSSLQEKILHDPTVFANLLQYLTIPTSEMFRDPSYFKAIRERVIPILRTYPSFKIWIAGCSTGEEAYSFAILLREEGLTQRSMIYATDINPKSLATAEKGIFPGDRIKEYTQNYQKAGGKASFADYFEANFGSMLFDRTLKDNIIFADHSLATDEVFGEMVLVSCRNVMIYFEDELQDRAIRLFHESLSHKGFLGIGMKESLRFTSYADKFEEFAKEEKIYQKL